MGVKELVDKILLILEIITQFTSTQLDDDAVKLLHSISNSPLLIEFIEKWLNDSKDKDGVYAAMSSEEKDTWDHIRPLLPLIEKFYFNT